MGSKTFQKEMLQLDHFEGVEKAIFITIYIIMYLDHIQSLLAGDLQRSVKIDGISQKLKWQKLFISFKLDVFETQFRTPPSQYLLNDMSIQCEVCIVFLNSLV